MEALKERCKQENKEYNDALKVWRDGVKAKKDAKKAEQKRIELAFRGKLKKEESDESVRLNVECV